MESNTTRRKSHLDDYQDNRIYRIEETPGCSVTPRISVMPAKAGIHAFHPVHPVILSKTLLADSTTQRVGAICPYTFNEGRMRLDVIEEGGDRSNKALVAVASGPVWAIATIMV